MKLRKLLTTLHAEREAYHAKAHTLTPPQIAKETAKFKSIRTDIQSALVEGAKDCPDCGNKPHGIFHDGTPQPFEIGCLQCRNHRVRGTLPDDALEAWNAAKGGVNPEAAIKDENGVILEQGFNGYLQPREPNTVVATLRDNTGLVTDERTLRVHTPTK